MSATLVSNDGWFTSSWRSHPARQMPAYSEDSILASVEARLGNAAPVVRSEDSARLREAMANLSDGHVFLLKDGDSAETNYDPLA